MYLQVIFHQEVHLKSTKCILIIIVLLLKIFPQISIFGRDFNLGYIKHCLDKQNIELKNSNWSISKEFEVLNNFLHRSYLFSVETNLKHKSKFFWTYINTKRNGNDDSIVICNWFNTFFQSVYSDNTFNIYNNSDATPVVETSWNQSWCFNNLITLNIKKVLRYFRKLVFASA